MKKSILCMLMISLGLNVNAQTDAEMVRSTVVKSDIESHIYFLASDELKGRQTGSDELKIAASYLANHLRKYGVKPAGDNDTYYQNVPFEKVSAPASIHFKANDFSSEKFLAMSVKNIDFNGDAVYLGYGTKEDLLPRTLKAN